MSDAVKKALLEIMLNDLLDSVSHLYGPDGLAKVVEGMKRANRAREDRAEMDALEKMLATHT